VLSPEEKLDIDNSKLTWEATMCQVTGRVLADMLTILCQFQQCKSQLEETL